MIKFIRTYLDKKAKEKEDREIEAKFEKETRKANWIKEIKALRLIAYQNAMYIRASITVVTSTSVSAKGATAAETKQKREYLRSQLAWLKSKLPEEEGMVEYYDSLLTN